MKRFLLAVLTSSLALIGLISLDYHVPGALPALAAAWQRLTLPLQMARLSAQPPDDALLMPVADVRLAQVADTWGAARAGGRRHEGQDIFAARGAPVLSATQGYVVRITDRTLGGNSVFVLGAGGYRYYYTHLDAFAEELAVGDRVDTDTVLGYVGNSGNAATTPPHLHFGVYTPAGPVNPYGLLVEREGSEAGAAEPANRH